MEPCRGEVDITIVDRISAILNPQPICTCNPVINARDAVSVINTSVHIFLKIFMKFFIILSNSTDGILKTYFSESTDIV